MVYRGKTVLRVFRVQREIKEIPDPRVSKDLRESQASRAGLPANLRHCGRLVSPRVIEAAQLEADWLQHFREISVGTLSSQTAPTNHARRVGDKPPTCEFVIDGVAEREQRAFGRTHEVGTVERARAGVQRRGSDSN